MSLLPKEKHRPRPRFSQLTTFLFGEPKIGKTSFCAQFPDAILLATEPGYAHLSVHVVDIDSWAKLLAAWKEIRAGGHGFRTIVIDTIDNAWRFLEEGICKQAGVNDINDGGLGYGKGNRLALGHLRRFLLEVAASSYGLVMISHARDREFDSPTTGGKATKRVSSLPDKVETACLEISDFIFYLDQRAAVAPDGKSVVAMRLIHTKPSPFYLAGDRTGRLPAEIPLNFPTFARTVGAAMASFTDEEGGTADGRGNGDGDTTAPADTTPPEASPEETPETTNTDTNAAGDTAAA